MAAMILVLPAHFEQTSTSILKTLFSSFAQDILLGAEAGSGSGSGLAIVDSPVPATPSSGVTKVSSGFFFGEFFFFFGEGLVSLL